jgi:hypothetical protein
MATRIKIKTFENSHTHFDTHRNNYTLCGLETGGDKGIGIQMPKNMNRKVNYPDCIRIVEFCHKIKTSEWENSLQFLKLSDDKFWKVKY